MLVNRFKKKKKLTKNVPLGMKGHHRAFNLLSNQAAVVFNLSLEQQPTYKSHNTKIISYILLSV